MRQPHDRCIVIILDTSLLTVTGALVLEGASLGESRRTGETADICDRVERLGYSRGNHCEGEGDRTKRSHLLVLSHDLELQADCQQSQLGSGDSAVGPTPISPS